ncbi:MAG: putative TPR repeat methyltransferase [Gammaproteobacteria bacterium]|jgi:predicted TPR repeat methyltransferase
MKGAAINVQSEADKDQWLVNGTTDAESVASYYDDWASRYDDELRAWNYQSPTEAARLLGDYAPQYARVLDAGCGTGLSGTALVAEGFRNIVGVDISSESLRIAERRGVYADLLQANLQELPIPFSDNAFDALTCVGVLTYVSDTRATLLEFCRLVRPGGHIVLTCRDDFYVSRDYAGEIKALSEAQQWRLLYESPPSDYLPGNEAFDARVIYLSFEVC